MYFITKKSNSSYLETETITDFLEELKLYSKNYRNECNCVSEIIFSNLIIYEIFLYILTLSLKNKNYQLIHDLIYVPYYFKDSNSQYRQKPSSFVDFNNHSIIYQQLDYYSPNPEWRNTSLAHLILDNINPKINSEQLIDMEYLLFYIGLMYKGRFERTWFPNLYLFKKNDKIDLLRKLSKQTFFEKVKTIFDVNFPEEFISIAKINNNIIQQYRFPNNFHSPLMIEESIDFNNICKYKG